MAAREPQTITKKELVNRIADSSKQTKVVVKDIVQQFLDEIVRELSAGNRLEFREFGVFEVKERAARTAQNPRTLEKVEVPAKRVVKFKVGRLMRQNVGDDDEDGADRADRALRDADADSAGARASRGARGGESSKPGGADRAGKPPARPAAPASPDGGSGVPGSLRSPSVLPGPPKTPPPKPPSNSPF